MLNSLKYHLIIIIFSFNSRLNLRCIILFYFRFFKSHWALLFTFWSKDVVNQIRNILFLFYLSISRTRIPILKIWTSPILATIFMILLILIISILKSIYLQMCSCLFELRVSKWLILMSQFSIFNLSDLWSFPRWVHRY